MRWDTSELPQGRRGSPSASATAMKIDADNLVRQKGWSGIPDELNVDGWGRSREVLLCGIVVVLDERASLLVKPLKSSQADNKEIKGGPKLISVLSHLCGPARWRTQQPSEAMKAPVPQYMLGGLVSILEERASGNSSGSPVNGLGK